MVQNLSAVVLVAIVLAATPESIIRAAIFLHIHDFTLTANSSGKNG
jgi:hypothetical protein